VKTGRTAEVVRSLGAPRIERAARGKNAREESSCAQPTVIALSAFAPARASNQGAISRARAAETRLPDLALLLAASEQSRGPSGARAETESRGWAEAPLLLPLLLC
jgi:hypothetical protein